MNPDTPIVEARGLGRRFGQRTVLEAVDLDVKAGQAFGVVGPDGAGKTTLLQILAAILRPSTGACRVLGEDVRAHPERIQARVDEKRNYAKGRVRVARDAFDTEEVRTREAEQTACAEAALRRYEEVGRPDGAQEAGGA